MQYMPGVAVNWTLCIGPIFLQSLNQINHNQHFKTKNNCLFSRNNWCIVFIKIIIFSKRLRSVRKSPYGLHPLHKYTIPAQSPHYHGVVNSTHASTFNCDCQTPTTRVVIIIIVLNFVIIKYEYITFDDHTFFVIITFSSFPRTYIRLLAIITQYNI